MAASSGRARPPRARRRSPPGSGRSRRSGSHAAELPQSSARETITAKSAGWTTSIRSSQAPSRSRRTSFSEKSTWGARAASQRSIDSAKVAESSSRPAAIRAHWEPWPGKTKASLEPGRPGLWRRLGARCPGRGRRAPPRARRVGADDHGPVSQGGSGGDQGVGDVGGVGVGLLDVGGEASAVSARAPPVLSPRAPRGSGRGRALLVSLGGLRVLLWCLLEDQVGVGAADAEGGDAGSPGAIASLPLPGLGQQLDLPRAPVDLGARLVDVKRLGQRLLR